MEHKTFRVPNIGCDGCVRTVENELSELEGVKTVKAELDSKMVTVEWDNPASWDVIVTTLEAIEYPPEA
ncbi:MAG: heavy-metal-associated domain-containing protein [Chloroflexi bacterium]|nr:MAG: heavy-metal-associated domain-containing protein [Chloroflexota bacterium]